MNRIPSRCASIPATVSNVHKFFRFICQFQKNNISKEHYQQEMELFMTIPGVKGQAATTLIAKTGVKMEMFLTASAIVGRASL